MGKAARRRREQASRQSDGHAEIAREAEQLRSRCRGAICDADDVPALGALLGSARASVERGIPARFEHDGRTYWLRVSVGLARLEVFDTATAREPLTTAISCSVEEFGHSPGH